MITNIIRELIKEYPNLATSTLHLYTKREDEIVVITSGVEDIKIVVSNIPKFVDTTDDWKKKKIASSIYTAAKFGWPLSELAGTIDYIINRDVILWKL